MAGFNAKLGHGASGWEGFLVGAVLLLGAMSVLSFNPLGLADYMRGKGLDMVQWLQPRALPAEKTDRQAVLIELDSKEADPALGWPWTRLAQLIGTLSDAGASSIVLSPVLDRPDPASPERIVRYWQSAGNDAARGTQALDGFRPHDAVLGEALDAAPVVLAFETRGEITPAAPPVKTVPANIGKDAGVAFPAFDGGARLGLSTLIEATRGHGDVTIYPDADGVVRSLPLFVTVKAALAPSASLEALRLAQGAAGYRFERGTAETDEKNAPQTHITAILAGDTRIPVTPQGAYWLHFPKAADLTRIPASHVLSGGAGMGVLKNAVAVIGPSPARGGGTAYPVSGGATFSGAEILTASIDQMLRGHTIVRPGWAALAEQAFLAITGLLVLLLAVQHRPWATLALAFAGFAALTLASWSLLSGSQIWLDPAAPGFSLLAIALGVTGIESRRLRAFRRRLEEDLKRKLPAGVAARLAKRTESPAFLGDAREATVLFCDLRSLDQLAARYSGRPEELTQTINRFRAVVAQKIRELGGTVDSPLGTTSMGLWNVPEDCPDHAFRACDCALRIIAELEKLNRTLGLEVGDGPGVLDLSIGIETGPVVAGNIGTLSQANYTAFGDAVTHANRLYACAELYGPAIVVGERAGEIVKDRFALLEIDKTAIGAGKAPSRIFALFGNPVVRASPPFKALVEAHQAVFAAYRQRKWPMARALVHQCRRFSHAVPTLYDLYERRIDYYESHDPDSNWDGAFRSPLN